MRRAPTIVLATLLPAAGCADLGLDGNVPLEHAEMAAPSELVAAAHARPAAEAEDVIVDGRLWIPWGRPAGIGADGLRPVGSTGGVTVYARAWDTAPLEALFVRADVGEWQRYAPVLGRSGGS